jgi:hypothetical protein
MTVQPIPIQKSWWIVHSFNNHNHFTSYTHSHDESQNVEITDNIKLAIAGTGSVSIDLQHPVDISPLTMTMKHAIHVPELSGNYFSVSAATDSRLIVSTIRQ